MKCKFSVYVFSDFHRSRLMMDLEGRGRHTEFENPYACVAPKSSLGFYNMKADSVGVYSNDSAPVVLQIVTLKQF
ncbi:hypothetical protein Tco_1228043 [Tanacetum coccineum]